MNNEKLLQTMKRYAESQGFKIKPDKKMVDFVIIGLLNNEREFGYRYCPCRAITGDKEQDRKIICPCVHHREDIERMGRCHCGLFVK